ncbi:hypothetical protein Btru_075230 [Bulinus truncatus]|nr:hypothetical protein Btru_075230 [Bulinus truncatus]
MKDAPHTLTIPKTEQARFPVVMTFVIEKKDLEGGLVHPQGTVLLRLTGPNATKATMPFLIKMMGLHPSDVSTLYRFESPYMWYLKTSNVSCRSRLINKQFGDAKNFKVTISPFETDNVKVTLHWLSTNIARKRVEEIFESFAEPGSLTRVEKVSGSADKWGGFLQPKKDKELPHYISIRYEGDAKIYKVLVTIPGRRQKCWTCGDDSHWSNQRPIIKGPNINSKTHSQPKTYADMVSAVLPSPQQPSGSVDDGFTLVRRKKNQNKTIVELENKLKDTIESNNSRKRFRNTEQTQSAPSSPEKKYNKKRKKTIALIQ